MCDKSCTTNLQPKPFQASTKGVALSSRFGAMSMLATLKRRARQTCPPGIGVGQLRTALNDDLERAEMRNLWQYLGPLVSFFVRDVFD